jgi:hypothetical protein
MEFLKEYFIGDKNFQNIKIKDYLLNSLVYTIIFY